MVWQLEIVRNSFAKISFQYHVSTCLNNTEYILLLVAEKSMTVYLSFRFVYYKEHRGEDSLTLGHYSFAECGLVKSQLWLMLVESHSVGRGEDSVPIPLSV